MTQLRQNARPVRPLCREGTGSTNRQLEEGKRRKTLDAVQGLSGYGYGTREAGVLPCKKSGRDVLEHRSLPIAARIWRCRKTTGYGLEHPKLFHSHTCRAETLLYSTERGARGVVQGSERGIPAACPGLVHPGQHPGRLPAGDLSVPRPCGAGQI